jgi:hypothetical protein
MVRRLILCSTLLVAALAAIPMAATAAGAAQAKHSQSPKDACKNGGWRNLTDDQGHAFRNQGQCVAFKIHHPVSLADLAGTFTGTQSFAFGTDGCVFVHQIFDASYPSAAAGVATLHIEGCVDPSITNYAGTFTISTSGGSVSGSASGPIDFSASPTFDLTLAVTSGAGTFAGTTGTLHAAIDWPGGDTISGSVTT